MVKTIGKYMSSYSVTYWISILTILLLSFALFLSSNISTAPTRQMTSEVLYDSNEIKDTLLNIEKSFDVYNELLNEIAGMEYKGLDNAEWAEHIAERFTVVLESFHALQPDVSGYFINITDSSLRPLLQTYKNIKNSKESHISVLMDTFFISAPGGLNDRFAARNEPIFIAIPNDITQKLELSYTAPLYINDVYRGFFGVTVDIVALKASFAKEAAYGRIATLLTSNLEILATTGEFPVGARLEGINSSAFARLANEIKDTEGDSGYIRLRYDGKTWMNIFVVLPSGQIFWESFMLSERLANTNLLIAILSVFAVFCLWMVHKRDSVSPFDRLSTRVFGKVALSDAQEISYKASFGTHIGFVSALFALTLFTLIGNTGMVQKIGYIAIFIIATISISLFRKAQLTVRQRYVYLAFYLLTPVVMHHLAGGFAVQNGSRILPWCVVTVTISSFLLNEKQNRAIFSLFVTILFLDAIIEIFLIPGTNPEYVIRFMAIIFSLGFALFVSTDLYVTGVLDVVQKRDDAYVKLQNAQSKIVKEEKMITLGRLIAGIAHEINTPLGAIKASAEGIDTSLQKAFMALIDARTSLDEVDKEYFFRLVELTEDSLADMYTSMQIRKAKPQIRAYFEELGCEDPDLMLQKLIRLEICNLDRIQDNKDIFASRNIEALLSLLIATAPIIKGSYIILEAAGKAYKIIFALKSYSYTNVSSDPGIFNLTQSIDNALLLLYNQTKFGVEVIRRYDGNIPELIGNVDELAQVWLNLFQNAIQAMGGNGILTVTIQKEGELVHISVSDNGSGISPDAMPYIFEPFYTTKSIGEGTGLGLDICKKIITGHQGIIEAESEPGVHTTFHVWLPIS